MENINHNFIIKSKHISTAYNIPTTFLSLYEKSCANLYKKLKLYN